MELDIENIRGMSLVTEARLFRLLSSLFALVIVPAALFLFYRIDDATSHNTQMIAQIVASDGEREKAINRMTDGYDKALRRLEESFTAKDDILSDVTSDLKSQVAALKQAVTDVREQEKRQR